MQTATNGGHHCSRVVQLRSGCNARQEKIGGSNMVRQPTWQRVILLVVLAYEGIGALLGGSLFVVAPDGHLMGIPVEVMHGFFTRFFIPGLILLGLGLLNCAAFIAVWRRTRPDWLAAGLALCGLIIWFVVEIAVLRELHWLHAMWGLPVLLGAFMALPLIPSEHNGQPFIKRHPVSCFYVLAFLIGWGGIVLAIGVNGGLPRTPDEFSQQVGSLIPAMFLGPSLAGLLMTALVSGKAGFVELFARLRKWRVGGRWFAVALLTAPLVFVVVSAVLSLASPVFLPGVVTTTGGKASYVLLGLMAGLSVGVCEELGWTGFAIPRLQLRHGVLATGLISGVLWAIWHCFATVVWPTVALSADLSVPIYLTLGGIGLVAGQLLAFRVLMVWVYERTESLLLAMLMHTSLTASTFILGPAVVAGSSGQAYGFVLGVAWWLVVGVVLLANHGHLGRQSSRGSSAPRGSGRRWHRLSAVPQRPDWPCGVGADRSPWSGARTRWTLERRESWVRAH
jgi:membrane protease YdiL (CAAX protease family)